MTSELRYAAHSVLLASFVGPNVPAWLVGRIEDGLGGVCLFGGNLARGQIGVGAALDVAATLRAARPDVLVATDEEGGDVTRLWAATGSPLPGNAALGAVDDVELTAAVSEALGSALLSAGIDLVLAPVADVNAEPANPVIGVRSFGADAELVARHVAAAVTGFHAAGVAACAKHFPGHGATRVDSHHGLPTVDAPAELLARRELVPFRAAIRAGTAAVMTAHLVVPTLDSEPATFSHRLLADVLRADLGFEGAVVTDALDMAGAGGPSSIPTSVVRAVAAGADLCCLGSEGTDELLDACVASLVDAVRSGVLPGERLLDASTRVGHIRRLAPSTSDFDAGRLASLGAQAAFRALRVDGELPANPAGAHVVELDRVVMVAAGDVPWSVGAAVAAEHADVTVEHLGPDETDRANPADILRRASGRTLIVVVRDPRRAPAQARLVTDLLAARPDAVVVDVGWPATTPQGAGHISTFGASAASTRAAARLLAGFELKEAAVRYG